MTKPITRIYAVFALLFAGLVYATSSSTVFHAKALNDNSLNKRGVLEAARIKRGVIRAADGAVLAQSRREQGGVYQRRYPQGSLFAHAVGYSFTDIGQAGLERTYNGDRFDIRPAAGPPEGG